VWNYLKGGCSNPAPGLARRGVYDDQTQTTLLYDDCNVWPACPAPPLPPAPRRPAAAGRTARGNAW